MSVWILKSNCESSLCSITVTHFNEFVTIMFYLISCKTYFPFRLIRFYIGNIHFGCFYRTNEEGANMFLRNDGNAAIINVLPSPKDIIIIYSHCESFRVCIIVQSVQNAALWVLLVVCVGSLWAGCSETWILCSLNPHFPCDSAFFYQSCQNFHNKNSVKSSINFVFPTHILRYVLKQQKLACCYYFKFFESEIGGRETIFIYNFLLSHLSLCYRLVQWSNLAHLTTLICFYNMVVRPRPLSIGQLGYSPVHSMLGKCPRHA